MKLTFINRIVMVFAGLAILFLLFFPPFEEWKEHEKGHWIQVGHRWVGNNEVYYGPGDYRDARVDHGCLTVEIALVMMVAGLVMLLAPMATAKKKPDKET